MKLKNDPKLLVFISELNDINELNMSLSDIFLSLISNRNIANPKELEILSKSYNRDVKDVFVDKIVDFLDIDLDVEDNQYIFDNHIKNSIKEADPALYLDNSYNKNIKINNIKENDYRLFYDHYDEYELFPLDDVKTDDTYIEKTSLGYFSKPFNFISLSYKGVTWMSLNPNEINTMKDDIDKAKGNVLVFGLGLGYFPFMISLKEEVKSITIVEKDRNIISLFKKHLLNQFPHKEKINIIEIDALNYKFDDGHFDYVYIDLWHNCEDGINLYLHYKEIEKSYKSTIFMYWLNDGFIALLRRAAITLLYEHTLGFKDENYKQSETVFDELINKLYFKNKNLQINSVEELKHLLSEDQIVKLFIS